MTKSTLPKITLPTIEESLIGWQEMTMDKHINPTVDTFGRAVADKLLAFRASTPAAKFAYHFHRHMGEAIAICYVINDNHYLWMSVFPDNEEHKDHRATVTMARKSLQAKVEDCALCVTPDDAATAIIGEIKRVCKIG